MRWALVLILVAAVAATAVADSTSGSCTAVRKCTLHSDCLSGSCCNGVCSDVASATRSVLGEFCGIAAPCQPACAVRPGLSCSSGRCERSQLGLDCPCEPTGVPCGPSLFCDHNVNRTAAENVCRMQTVPATGACAVDSQCPGTCDNGVCMGLASNVTCSSSLQCESPLVCVTELPSGVRKCMSTKYADGAACAANYDCASGLCNMDSVCAAPFTTPAGSNCTSAFECESHYCVMNNKGAQVCASAVYSRGENEACPDGDVNCRAGFRCVGATGPGAFKENVCRSVVNRPCNVFSSCGDNAACACTGNQRLCQPNAITVLKCQAEKLAYYNAIGVASSPLPDLNTPWMVYGAAQGTTAQAIFTTGAAYMCCEATKGSLSAALLSLDQVGSTKLECTTTSSAFVSREEAGTTAAEWKRCKAVDAYISNAIVTGVQASVKTGAIIPSSPALASAPAALTTAAAVLASIVLMLAA